MNAATAWSRERSRGTLADKNEESGGGGSCGLIEAEEQIGLPNCRRVVTRAHTKAAQSMKREGRWELEEHKGGSGASFISTTIVLSCCLLEGSKLTGKKTEEKAHTYKQ